MSFGLIRIYLRKSAARNSFLFHFPSFQRIFFLCLLIASSINARTPGNDSRSCSIYLIELHSVVSAVKRLRNLVAFIGEPHQIWQSLGPSHAIRVWSTT